MPRDPHFQADFQEHTPLAAQEIDVLVEVLSEIAPLQAAYAGQNTVRAIAEGVSYESVDGGRHLDLSATIGLLSGLAGIAQYVVQVVSSTRKRKRLLDEGTILSIVHEELSDSQILSELMNRDPNVLKKLIDVVLRLQGSPSTPPTRLEDLQKVHRSFPF